MHSGEEYYKMADNLMRISCGAVQDVFRDNWKRRTGSEWTKASAGDLIRDDGKVFYSNCEFPPQKRLLEEGKVEDWDLTLLTGLLKCLAAQCPTYNVNWKLKKAALYTLCEERNRLAHNAQKKISAAAYQQVEASVRDSLSKLGVNKEKVDKWISDAMEAFDNSSGALEQARKIEELGDKEYSRRNYQGARVQYDEALLLPCLPSVKLCALYEKRASCYLESGMRERNVKKQTGFYDQAMNDIREALSKDESSWNAHSLQAKIYKAKNDLEKAIEHLEKALAISPSQDSLREELEDCKITHGHMKKEAHLDSASQPRTLKESHAMFMKVSGIKNTPEEFFRNQKEDFEKSTPGSGDVFVGDSFAEGWSGKINYKEAARHYENAMAKGNASGIIRLADLYLEGKGVQKDSRYGIELMEKAANMPETILIDHCSNARKAPGIVTGKIFNPGVTSARHVLGLHYHEGVGVGQNFKKAIEWYTKAVKSGSGRAANNLARMYITGEGMQQDWKMAEMYWKQAVELGSPTAAQALCAVYLEQGEPELTALWLKKAVEFDHPMIDIIPKYIDEVKRSRKELEIPVKQFEREHSLSTHGLTFMQREKRMWVTRVYQMAKKVATGKGSETTEQEAEECAKNYAKYFNPILLGVMTEKNNEFQWTGKLSTDSLHVISKIAQEGNSPTAQRVMAVSGYMDQFYQLWKENGLALSEDKATALIDFVYQITCLEPHLFYFTSDEMEDKFKCFIRSQFEAHGNDKGDLDMKLRICYAMYANERGQHFGIQVLKEGIRRYPNELVYYDQLSCLYGRNSEYKAGLDVVNQGLGRFPHDVGLLYNKAVHTRLLESEGKPKGYKDVEKTKVSEDVVQDPGVVRSAYQDFIKAAPEDHRKIPEAYYCISQSYWDEIKAAKRSKTKDEKGKQRTTLEDKVLEFYEMGKRAELKQLPFYLPYDSRTKALLVRWVLTIMVNSRHNDSSSNKAGEKWDGTLPKFMTCNKDYLKDPHRIDLVTRHRQTFREVQLRLQKTSSGEYVVEGFPDVPKGLQKLPKSLAGLQAITLQQMDRTQETIYEGKIINLTLIEDPIVWIPSTQMVAMDDNRDTIRVVIPTTSFNWEMRDKLVFGARFSILNPYMRRCLGEGTEIRVDIPESIFYLGQVEKMCRYCGQENAKYSCGKCGWAEYCNRECQISDWKELKHKLICPMPKANDLMALECVSKIA